MSAKSRRKGAGYEREVAQQLSAMLGEPVKRNLSQSRDGGGDFRVGPLVIEAKRRKHIAPLRWYEQAKRAAEGDAIPMVVMREDNGESMVLLKLTDLFGPLLLKLLKLGGEQL